MPSQLRLEGYTCVLGQTAPKPVCVQLSSDSYDYASRTVQYGGSSALAIKSMPDTLVDSNIFMSSWSKYVHARGLV